MQIEKTVDPYQLAHDFANHTNHCLFITGKAGTGKTTFLKRLHQQSKKNLVVVAPTGVAAINAGGTTIHSFFQLPIRTLIPTAQSYKKMFAEQRMTSRKRQMIYHLELLVIDEISMVRADVLDAIDTVLRKYKYKPNIPFGGVQVIMIGDLFQLSPVVRDDDKYELEKYYDGPYFFQSNVMKQLKPTYIELDHVFRQQNQQFINLLNEVRENKLSENGKTLLNSRYIPNYNNSEQNFHITLTTHNAIADRINTYQLQQIDEPEFTFNAHIEDNFPENNFPTEQELVLKKGARVMFIKNDEDNPHRFYNGKIGVIHEITKNKIVVECKLEVPANYYDDSLGGIEIKDNKEYITVPQVIWENIRYKEDEQTGKITEESLGKFKQYPLRLAWAITIHKSQGLTFDNVIIDAERAFASGQVYVALSRCRTLEGIVLTSPLINVKLNNDIQVINYINSQPQLEESESKIESYKTEFLIKTLIDIFDFRQLRGPAEQLQTIFNEASSFNTPTDEFIKNLLASLDKIIPIGETFQKELFKIISNNNSETYSTLQKRLTAAEGYFNPILTEIANQIANMPCRSKNQDDATDFLRTAKDIYLTILLRLHLMKAISSNPTTDEYYEAKTNFTSQKFPITSIFEKNQNKPKNNSKKTDSLPTEGERLYQELAARIKTLPIKLTENQVRDISYNMPRNALELSKIKGIKANTIKNYGNSILQIVNQFIQEQEIQDFVNLIWKLK